MRPWTAPERRGLSAAESLPPRCGGTLPGSHAGNMAEVPIVVHPAIEQGGRPVVVRNELAGLAPDDHKVVEFSGGPVCP
ncbi:hypothetical protein OK006_3144 [Actinobacteria bacterium OK006]|nr:hypothetical protein OK006_3144 [Actinobacteria bacterium OK006]